MAASESFKKSHSQVFESSPAEVQQKISSKYSGSNILCKSLILIFVLVVILLFPSQAPGFITQSLLTNFWELLHLLFVGLAVCYGLFCKKCVEIECENRSENDTSPNTFISGFLNYPSFFEDGFENFCISDDKKVLKGYKENFYLDEDKKIRSFTSRNECGNVCGNFSDENYRLQNEYKPLGLPIRSLRSGIVDIHDFPTKTGESSRLKIPVSDDNEGKVERISGLAYSNLGKKFEEVVGPSVVPWRSRSGRMEMKEEVRNADSQSQLHCRPHSVGELEFEHLESRAFQYHNVSSSRSSSESSSSRSTVDSSSVLLEVSKLKTHNLEREDDFEDSSVMSSKSKESSSIDSFSEMEMWQSSKYSFLNSKKTMQNQLGDANQRSSSLDLNVKSSNSFGNSKKSSMQDQLDDDNQRSSSLDLNVKSSNTFGNSKKSIMQDQLAGAKQRKDSGNSKKSRMQDELAGAKQRKNSSYSSAKSSNLTEIVARAKSVRTIRSSKYVSDKLKKSENTPHQIEDDDDDDGGMFGQVEAHVFISPVKKGEPKHSPVDKQKNTSDKVYPLPNSTVFQNQIRKSQESAHLVSNEKEPGGLNEVDEEEELAGSEVDRKADEFITKFREQIRLQKAIRS